MCCGVLRVQGKLRARDAELEEFRGRLSSETTTPTSKASGASKLAASPVPCGKTVANGRSMMHGGLPPVQQPRSQPLEAPR